MEIASIKLRLKGLRTTFNLENFISNISMQIFVMSQILE